MVENVGLLEKNNYILILFIQLTMTRTEMAIEILKSIFIFLVGLKLISGEAEFKLCDSCFHYTSKFCDL